MTLNFLIEFVSPSNYYFNVQSVPLFIIGILTLWLGILVFVKRKGTTGLFFLLICLSVTIWLSATGMGYLSKDPTIAKWWFKCDNFSVMFISVNAYSFTAAFLGLKRKKIILIGYILACIFGITELSTNYLVTGVRKFFWGYFPAWGLLSYPFFVFFFGYMLASFTEYIISYRKIKFPIRRNQIKYMAIALAIAYTGSIDYLATFGIEIYPAGYISIFLFIAIVAYAIIKHSLMDIYFVIGRGITYATLTPLVAAAYIIVYLIPLSIIPKLILVFLLSLASVYFITKIFPKTEVAIRQLLYKDKYKYQEKLREIAGSIPTKYDMERLLKYTVDTTAEAVECSPCSIMLMDSVTKSYSIEYNIGLPDELIKRITFYPDTEIIQKLRWGNRPIVKEELLEDDPVKERMDSIKAEVSVPIVRKDKLLGILNLNHKASGDIYSHEDLSILADISKFLGMAIENITLSKREHQEELITYLNNIAYALAHELKNKSQTIITTAQAILSMLPQVTNVPQDLITLAKIANDKILEIDSLVNELVTYSNVQQREGFGPVDINKVLDESLSITDGEIKNKKINVIKRYTESNMKHGDRGQLIQIFVSVIRNSIEAMEEGGILTLGTLDEGEFWKISIEDTGKGIPENHLGSIFEPFFTTKHDHKGLGLSIARRIIYDHAGEIKVESTEGKGTIIYIYLPKQMPEDKLRARAEIKRREDISHDRIKTKDYQDKQRKENQNGQT